MKRACIITIMFCASCKFSSQQDSGPNLSMQDSTTPHELNESAISMDTAFMPADTLINYPLNDSMAMQ
jgi:hypothetical protein